MSDASETSQVGSGWQQLREFFREELKPRPGRLKEAFIRVGGTLLGMWVGLAIDLPELGAILSLAFFASTSDRAAGMKIGLGVPPTAFVILILETLLLNVFGTTPLVRVVAFVVVIFSSLYLLQAAQVGAMFLLAGVFGKLFLNLWDENYPSELIQRLQLWIVWDLAIAGLCALAVSSVFGDRPKNPVTEFRYQLASRLTLLAHFLCRSNAFSEKDEEQVRAEALSASDTLLPLLAAAQKKDAAIKARCKDFTGFIRLTGLLLHQSVILTTYSCEDQQQLRGVLTPISDRCAALAKAVRSGKPINPPEELSGSTSDSFASTMASTVRLAEDVLAGKVSLPEDQKQESSKGFFRPDAFSNPDYLNNAIRATVAAFACYCLIAGSNWSGISTAITTCLITALTTVEQTRQKQILRFGGAALGGILGLLSIVFILPRAGITELSVVTGLVTFLGGWIVAGTPKLSYAGVQVVICFYLGVFGESSTPTSLTTLRDRVVGIFIGNLAMWLFYDRIQPVWTPNVSRSAFADELAAVGRLTAVRPETQNSEKTISSLLGERKAFVNASAQLKAMGDSHNFQFSFNSKLQRRKALEIRKTDVQLQQLFSMEFVAIETSLLRLPSMQRGASSRRLSDSVLTLASLVREAGPIPMAGAKPNERESPPDERLVERLKIEFADLFETDRTST